MTGEEREDAIKFFKEVAKYEVNNAKYSKLAIEALEQEPILDKIRAEIMALRNIRAEEFDIDSDVFDDRVILRSDVLDILDKYKAEIEPQESEDDNAEQTYSGRGVKIYKEEIEDNY